MSTKRKRTSASDMIEEVSEEEYEPQIKKRKTDQKAKGDKKSKNNKKNGGTKAYTVNYMKPGEECPELPPEILVQIFGYLPRKALTSAGQVNHHWEMCSKDDSLFWLPIWKIKLREDKGGYDSAQNWSKTKPYTKKTYQVLVPKAAREHHFGPHAVNAKPVSATMIQGGTQTGLNSKHSHDVTMFVVLKDKEGQPIAMTRFVDPNAYWAPDLSMDCYRHSIRPINKIASGVKGYGLDIEVQPWRIERDVREGDAQHQAVGGFVRRIVKKLKGSDDHPNITEYFDPKECYLPAFVPTLSEQPDKIKDVKLHQYQLSAINWMLETETNPKAFTVSPLFPAVGNMSVFIGEREHKFVTNDNAKEHDWNLVPKGGILADEMGLGKTMEMIGLILSNPMKQAPEDKPYFSTKATLVVCPNHLVQQWHDEIQKHSSDKLKIIQLTTINHIKATTYQQIIDADIVIVSYNLLQNKNYVAFPRDPKTFNVKKMTKYELKRVGIDGESSVAELTAYKRLVLNRKALDKLQDKEPKSIKGVILDHFHWHRVVMDEGHELINDKTVNDFMLANFKKTYAWYMTGTPFPTFGAIDGIRKFLNFTAPRPNEAAVEDGAAESDEEEDGYTFGKYTNTHIDNVYFAGYYEYRKSAHKKFGNWNKWADKPYHILYFDNIINGMLFENLLWRNTKASVADEYKMTDTKHECVLLDFTPIESAIYEDLSQVKPSKKQLLFGTAKAKQNERESDPLRELCCKLDPLWGDNLIDIRNTFILKKSNDIQTDEVVIKALQNRYVECKAMLANKNTGGWDVYEARKFVGDYPTKMDEVKHKLAIDGKIKKQLEDYDPEVELKNKKEKLIEKRGTKLGNLVVYLQKLFENAPTTRVIIFSQFSDYLQLIESVLEQHDISSCTVEGNVYRKTKALGKFKDADSEVKVILLSLSKAASGTNLIEASHVILMDPMSGSREEAQAYEQQAIGRAQRQGQTKPVTVVRFIIKNTIEHSLYLRNVSQNKLSRSSSMLVRSGSLVNFNLDNEENSGDGFSGDLNDAEAGDTDAMSDD